MVLLKGGMNINIKERINKKFSMINYVAFSTMIIWLFPTWISLLLPDKYKVIELVFFLFFSVFWSLVIFIFIDDIKYWFENLTLKWNILFFLFFLIVIIWTIILQVLKIFNIFYI